MWRREDVSMWGLEDVKMWVCEDEKMWRFKDAKMRRCEDEKVWRCEDVRMRRCEDEKMWRCEDVKVRRCEDEKMRWRWEVVKMRRCEDEKMWRWEDEKMRWRCEDEMMWRLEDVKMRRWHEDAKMKRWEHEKMKYRPPLLEEPCAQTLSGKIVEIPREKGCVVDVYLLILIGWDLHGVQQTRGFRKLSIETCRSRPPFLWQGNLQRATFPLALDLGSRLQGSLHSNKITNYATKKSTYTISTECLGPQPNGHHKYLQ